MAYRKVCKFCERGVSRINYKDQQTLSRLVTDRGKILPRRATGTCASHPRQLGTAIKRARYLALIPYIEGYHS